MHAAKQIVAEKDLTLELSAVTAFPSGLLLQFTLLVTGIRADFARHETRPLTDPSDASAQWSYLAVRIVADTLDGTADPHHPIQDLTDSEPYRTTPQYWIDSYPRTGTMTVTTSWTQIGLHPATFLLTLGPSPFPTTAGTDARR